MHQNQIKLTRATYDKLGFITNQKLNTTDVLSCKKIMHVDFSCSPHGCCRPPTPPGRVLKVALDAHLNS
jgi:hypothetical protein